MIPDSIIKILNQHPEVTKTALDFFTCLGYDSKMYEEIRELFEKRYLKYNNIHEVSGARLGNYTANDFVFFMASKIDPVPGGIAEIVIEELFKKNVLLKSENTTSGSRVEYRPNIELVKFLRDNNLLLNLFYGFNFIIKKYKSSVPIIEVQDNNGDMSAGTGFYVKYKNSPLIVTNKHVIEKQKILNLFYDSYKLDIKKTILSDNHDIAFILLDKEPNLEPLFLNKSLNVLDDIITIGYPAIPMTQEAYQVYHKGEVNSFVKEYNGSNLFVISAKTSSGNSGSPVIDKYGSVVGMVTKELFEKEEFYKKGKLPYYAAIPTTDILAELYRKLG